MQCGIKYENGVDDKGRTTINKTYNEDGKVLTTTIIEKESVTEEINQYDKFGRKISIINKCRNSNQLIPHNEDAIKYNIVRNEMHYTDNEFYMTQSINNGELVKQYTLYK